MAARKAIFLDKDGTLICDVPYNVNPERIVLSDHLTNGLKRFVDAGYSLFVVSNQSGVAKGYFGIDQLAPVEQMIRALLAAKGIELMQFYFCPHYPDGQIGPYSRVCDCRKPRPGMLKAAARDWNIDLSASWMIGDILDDVEAGNTAGCRTVLINNGNETLWELNESRVPDYIAASIDEAAEYILEGAASLADNTIALNKADRI
ncbi:D-glycero-alpha-D-manno-heptose-1,7-bisphosphate 7-phosphatase [Pedobacter deserti]|uniref:D-glycero-alpha-D-manno-heptose-1,7-bisphosphate 7-phosphatase n=1 Tax=Pedobacter deserti TaxID=2817382 RepID=UPI0021098CF2|nr:HAD family hydrolase [Pedobacter sp. SYSU D00382]